MATNEMVNADELRVGDVVRLSELEFSDAVVKCIDGEIITFFRPYVHTDGAEWRGCVYCYVGIEEFKAFARTDSKYRRIRRAGA